MSHQVLSRKYRPQTFADLVGQEHIARILTNTIASDRVGHAYLFVGPRGVGKTSTARIFARALNCSGRPLAPADIEPCGTCPSCVDIAAGSDLDVVEMDAASNNHVEDVRVLREQVGYATVRSPYRIWIVDEVHMLSLPAFNAFLKTLEEPPEQVKFLFCTTEEHKLPDTFKSRCQRVEFRPIDAAAMADRLVSLASREGATLDPELARAIASGALGGLRDAESLLEQLLAACPSGAISLDDLDALAGRAPAELLDRLAEAVDLRDASAALDAADACLASGCKPGVLMDQWLERIRGEMVKAARAGEPVARLARAIDVLLAKRAHLRAGADGVLVTQVAAVELARLPDARDLDKLIGALRGAATASPRESHARKETRDATVREGDPEPTPASRPSPRPPPESEPRSLNRERVAAKWPTFVEALRGRDLRLGNLVEQLTVSEVKRHEVHLRMPSEIDGARAMLARREIRIAFSQVANATYGAALAPVLVEDEPSVAPEAVVGVDLRGHPLVRLVTESTRGRLLSVEQRPRRASGPEGPQRGSARGDAPKAEVSKAVDL